MATNVAIFGGGAAGISTAFWLTSTPQLRNEFKVTVYTPGWRLGGKCASGRNMLVNGRIEEHGLHLLMGCYRHAFDTIRRCYAEWSPQATASPIRTWQDAFKPHCAVTLMELGASGWTPMHFDFPRNYPSMPGDPLTPPGASGCAFAVGTPELLDPLIDKLADFLQGLLAPYEAIVGYSVDLSTPIAQVRAAIQSPPDPAAWPTVRTQILAMLHASRLALEGLYFSMNRPYRLAIALLGLGVLIGWTKDLAFGGNAALDALDEKDLRGWLAECQTHPTVIDSAPVHALYSLAFAFRNGDAASLANGSMAAGVTLRFALEATLAYRCAPLWRMSAGMGDVVFMPLYEVLGARGVTFRFFHRLAELRLDAGGRIGGARLERQVTVASGDYRPWVEVKGLRSWPSQPDWTQLVSPDTGFNYEADAAAPGATTVDLASPGDFDVAVLAFPPPAIAPVAAGLAGRDPAWDAMLANSASVATQAYQLWAGPDLPALGWTLGSTVVTAYAPPIDSWADMTHVMEYESWGDVDPPRSLHYFCGCLDETAQGALASSIAGTAWAAQWLAPLWPALAWPPPATFERSSYARANRHGSERYMQTPAGSVKHRLRSDVPVFGNLYCAGDWTRTRFSGGCVEAAFESGKMVAASLCRAAGF